MVLRKIDIKEYRKWRKNRIMWFLFIIGNILIEYPAKILPILLLIIGFSVAISYSVFLVPYILNQLSVHSDEFNKLLEINQIPIAISISAFLLASLSFTITIILQFIKIIDDLDTVYHKLSNDYDRIYSFSPKGHYIVIRNIKIKKEDNTPPPPPKAPS